MTKTAKYYNNQGIMLQLEGRHEAAIAAFREALSIEPHHVTAHNNLAFLLAQHGHPEAALDHLEQALLVDSENATVHINKGNIHFKMGNLDLAYNHYTRALQIENENPVAWEMYAKLFTAASQPMEAAQAWAQAVQLAPGNADYRMELAVCLIASGLHDDARPLLEGLAEYQANNEKVWCQLGIVFLLRKDYGTATDMFTRALGLMPEDEKSRYHLGLTCLAIGENEKAEQEFRRIVQLYPDNLKARTDLAVLLLARGELGLAAQEVGACLEINPLHEKARYYQALIWHQMGYTTEVESALNTLADEVDGAYSQQARSYLDQYFHE